MVPWRSRDNPTGEFHARGFTLPELSLFRVAGYQATVATIALTLTLSPFWIAIFRRLRVPDSEPAVVAVNPPSLNLPASGHDSSRCFHPRIVSRKGLRSHYSHHPRGTETLGFFVRGRPPAILRGRFGDFARCRSGGTIDRGRGSVIRPDARGTIHPIRQRRFRSPDPES